MDAVVFESYGPADVLQLSDIPVPIPERGMVRIKVAAAGVNPADLKWRVGMFRDQVPLTMPHVLGYDVSGTIDELGEGVDAFQVGDRVCAMLDPVIKGGYAAFAVTDVVNLARIPDEMELDLAATVPTAALAAIQLIRKHLRPRPGEAVIVTGAVGAVGRVAMHVLRQLGARPVAAVRNGQQETALSLGASHAFALGEEAPGFDFHHVADVVGGEAVAWLCRQLPPDGRIMTLATTPIDPTDLPSPPSFVAVQPDGSMLEEALRMVLDGEFCPLEARAVALSCASQAHRILESGNPGGKIILHPW